MGLAFTACSDNEVIDIPVNQEPVIFNVADLNITAAAATASPIDLSALNYEGQSAQLCDIAIKDFPSDYELSIVMQISADESFTKFAEVPVAVEGNTVVATPSDLQGIYYANISKGPKERTIYARYAAYAVKDQASVRLGDPDLYYGPFALTIIPYPSDLVIEENYYLLGTLNDWSVANAVKMNHSDLNQYDDPVFTLKVDITPEQAAAGWWWKIVPQSTYVTGNWVDGDNAAYGVEENGSEELSGMLVGRTATADCGAGCLKVAGSYLLSINLEDGTYEFTLAIDNLWTPGNSNGWGFGSNCQMLYTNDYANYEGAAYLDGEFKFTSTPDWNGINYGKAAEDGALSTDGGAGNLSAAAGLYWCKVNIAGLTYSLSPINSLGVIGDATSKNWDGDVALTPAADHVTWEGDVTFNASGEWKIRANGAWDISFGGSTSNMEFNSLTNLATPGAGTYHVVFNLGTIPYTVTLTKK